MQEVGDEAALYALVRRFYDRMKDDLLIGFFFEGRDLDLIARGQTEFLLSAMGARPDPYLGKTPQNAHTALPPILQGHFDRRLVLLEATLRDAKLSERSIQTWVGFERAFEDVIVSR